MPSLIDWEDDSNSQLIAVTVDDDGDDILEFEIVHHGCWIERKEIFSESEDEVDAIGCSVCGRSQRKYRRTPRCPICGARMDLKEEAK